MKFFDIPLLKVGQFLIQNIINQKAILIGVDDSGELIAVKSGENKPIVLTKPASGGVPIIYNEFLPNSNTIEIPFLIQAEDDEFMFSEIYLNYIHGNTILRLELFLFLRNSISKIKEIKFVSDNAETDFLIDFVYDDLSGTYKIIFTPSQIETDLGVLMIQTKKMKAIQQI